MNKSFAALAVNFVGFQLLWFAAVYGAAAGWPLAAWGVLVPTVLLCWYFNHQWRDDLPMLCAGAVACLLFEPLWIAPGLIHYVNWNRDWLAPGWIWALWLGFAISFNYCLRWLRERLWLAAVFGGVGGVMSVTVGIKIGAAFAPMGWWPMAIAYGVGWALAVPVLAGLSRRLRTQRLKEDKSNYA